MKGDFYIGHLGIFTSDRVVIDLNWDFLNKMGALNSDEKPDITKINLYYADKQKQIVENIEQIENRFLIFLFNDYFGCGDAFWADQETDELCSFIIKDKMPELEDDESYSDYVYAQKIFTEEADEVFYQGRSPLDDDIDEYLNNMNINMKNYIRTFFPMIDVEIFMKSLIGETCNLSDDEISYCCSNPECGYCSVCSAYVIMTEKFRIEEWHHR
ncbi:hypothetical protein [Clostridium ganghwense]|uniref:DUF4240 domain-containing protein n=1 Tax=Clostridium ganghwense TaxID=312089 RepID=A0ABT4CT07_9CLOT|nr:hypothetical protein [Clostridium ganghwense]MCY6372203.1 hypothetical protein [Clostridium ganghwense]